MKLANTVVEGYKNIIHRVVDTCGQL